MKKLLMTLLMIFTVGTAFSQVKWFKTTFFAYKYETQYGVWTDWSDWERCVADVKMDLTNNKIVIYTNNTQIYYVYNYLGEVEDRDGQTVKFAVIDNEEDYGHIRLRVQKDGTKQLYVDFNDVMWVYNLN